MEENVKVTTSVDVPQVLRAIIVKLEDVHHNVLPAQGLAEMELVSKTIPVYVSQDGSENYATRINLGLEKRFGLLNCFRPTGKNNKMEREQKEDRKRETKK